MNGNNQKIHSSLTAAQRKPNQLAPSHFVVRGIFVGEIGLMGRNPAWTGRNRVRTVIKWCWTGGNTLRTGGNQIERVETNQSRFFNSSAAKTKPISPLTLCFEGCIFGINWVKGNKPLVNGNKVGLNGNKHLANGKKSNWTGINPQAVLLEDANSPTAAKRKPN